MGKGKKAAQTDFELALEFAHSSRSRTAPTRRSTTPTTTIRCLMRRRLRRCVSRVRCFCCAPSTPARGACSGECGVGECGWRAVRLRARMIHRKKLVD